ncbi:MAG: hypothetical protein ACE5JX_01725 [Acidobacteriota bacterium]
MKGWLLVWVLWTSFPGADPLFSSPPPGLCESGEARQVLVPVDCVTQGQLERILSFSPRASDARSTRQALETAARIASCINDLHRVPNEPERRKDFRCLQKKLLGFYQQVEENGSPPVVWHFADVLARASLRIHSCMLDQDLPVLRCLELMEEGFREYRSVFKSAAQIQADPEDPASAELAEEMGVSVEVPAPAFSELESFVDLALENAQRFPKLLGRQIGTALGAVLCDAYSLYLKRRPYMAYRYNLLIRFDGGNMAASARLYQFVERLKDFFRPAPGMPTFLELRPADWSTSRPPCGEEDWILDFPEFAVAPGFALPDLEGLERKLPALEDLLAQMSDLAEARTHFWKPFHSWGILLFRLAQSLKIGGSRNPRIWTLRHLLMEKARDAFLLRAVEPDLRPLVPEKLQAAISDQIQAYGSELLSDLRLNALTPFSEGYLEVGEKWLTDSQQSELHRLLAVAYAVRGDQRKALAHLGKSALRQDQLEKIRQSLREVGVGVPFER